MASLTRTAGVFNFSANFETLVAAPLDARLTVPYLTHLTDGATIPYPYLGMVVAVTSDSTPSNNGIYYCTDIGTVPAFASGTSVWTKLTDGASDTYVTGGTMSGTNLELYRNDGNTVTVDLSSLASDNNTYVTGGTVSGTSLTLGLNDGSSVTIDVSSLTTDTYVTGATQSGTTISLHFNNGAPQVDLTLTGFTGNYVTGGTSGADTGGTTNIDLDLGISDGSNVNIDLSQAFTFMNAAAVKKTVGGITTGDLAFASGKTLHEIIQMIFYPAIAPTISYSSVALTKTLGNLEEIGKIHDLTLTANFTKGTSVVAGQTTRYMGNPIDYNYTGDQITGTVTNANTGSPDTTAVSAYVVTQGVQGWSVGTDYNAVTPGGSTGPVYDDGTTYVNTNFTNAGTKTGSTSLEGVYPIYAATSSTTVLTKQALVSMINGNNLEYTIVAEANPGEHTFALPDVWLISRPLTAVYYFNAVSNQWDTVNKIGDWITTPDTQTIQGAIVNYTKYTKDVALPAAGSRKIKLVF